MDGSQQNQGSSAPRPADQPMTQPAAQVAAQAPAQAASPSPEKRRVHHTYIWLGGLRAAFWVLFALAIALAGILGQAIEDGFSVPVGVGGTAGMVAMALAATVTVVTGISIGLNALAYKYLRYELGPSELSLYSGIISKKRTHVPYQKIQSVDVKTSLMQRVMGVCNVCIDTAGGAQNKAVVIPYLTKQDAQALRNELYSLKNAMLVAGAQGVPAQGATPAAYPAQASTTEASAFTSPTSSDPSTFTPPSGQPVAAAPQGAAQTNVLDVGSEAWELFGGVFACEGVASEAASYEYGLTNKEILLTGISNGSVAGLVCTLVAGLASLVPIASSLTRDIIPESASAAAGELARSAASGTLSEMLPIVLVGALAIVAVVWVAASLAACVQYGGFRARRRGTRIEVERGLLQHDSVSLDIDRVQSVIVSQSFIRRLLGYCEVSLGKVNAAEPGSGSDSQKAKSLSNSGFVVHPFVKVDKIDGILHGLVPEYADLPEGGTKVAPVALRRGLVRRCILFGVGFWLAVAATAELLVVRTPFVSAAIDNAVAIAALEAVCMLAYAIAAIVFAFEVASTVLWARDSRFATSKAMVAFTNGGLSRSTVGIPRAKVQFAGKKTNPLQRRARTATVSATTAAGISRTTTSLIDVSAEVADGWLEWAEPRGTQEA